MNTVQFATKGSNFSESEAHYLKPVFDSRKSFYNKAEILRDDNNDSCLLSYGRPVALIIGKHAYINGTYSATTLRHIKEYLKQHGLPAESKSQIEHDYQVKTAGLA